MVGHQLVISLAYSVTANWCHRSRIQRSARLHARTARVSDVCVRASGGRWQHTRGVPQLRRRYSA